MRAMSRSDRAGKTHTALLEMRRAPQKQCEAILLLQSVFLKMSESEHSDGEFYYPGELSDSQRSNRKKVKRSNAASHVSSFHQRNENEK